MIKEIDIKDTNPFSKRIEYTLNNKTIGFLEYSLIYDRMEINNLKVEGEYQNQGIGTKLMSHLVSIAIIERVVNITLEVRLSNEKARNLYKKFGFREVALRKFYYGDENGILMEKQVM